LYQYWRGLMVKRYTEGRVYLTDTGYKVIIYSIKGGGDYPIHGAIFNANDEWRVSSWTRSGKSSIGEIFNLPTPRREYWLRVSARTGIPLNCRKTKPSSCELRRGHREGYEYIKVKEVIENE